MPERSNNVVALQETCHHLQDRVEELEGALEPFANPFIDIDQLERASYYGGHLVTPNGQTISDADFLRARQTLQAEDDDG